MINIWESDNLIIGLITNLYVVMYFSSCKTIDEVRLNYTYLNQGQNPEVHCSREQYDNE